MSYRRSMPYLLVSSCVICQGSLSAWRARYQQTIHSSAPPPARGQVSRTPVASPRPLSSTAMSSRAAALTLLGGAPCLDFANTSSGRGTPLLQEHLRSYELLLAWCEHAGLTAP